MNWEELESKGLVRKLVEPERENYFDVYGYACGCKCESSRDELCEHDAEIESIVERDGVWWYATEWRLSTDDQWLQGSSVGMNVGQDDATYWPDLKAECLDLYVTAKNAADARWGESYPSTYASAP